MAERTEPASNLLHFAALMGSEGSYGLPGGGRNRDQILASLRALERVIALPRQSRQRYAEIARDGLYPLGRHQLLGRVALVLSGQARRFALTDASLAVLAAAAPRTFLWAL